MQASFHASWHFIPQRVTMREEERAEMNADDLIEELNETLAAVFEDDEYDLSLNEDDGTIELATDDWTLVLETWPAGIAYLALDDEPDTAEPDKLRAEMIELIGPALRPLSTLNASSDGQLAAALKRTSDPLSNALAAVIG
jgi:hypothetical protein